MTQIGTAYVKIAADTDELNKGLKQSSGGIAKWGKGLAALGVAGGAAAGVAVVAGFLKDSVEAAEEAQRVQSQLERQVTQTAGSYDKYAEQIDATIQSTSMLAAVDDEDLAESFTKLVGSTGDVQSALDGMQAATDVAAARGVSLETATKAVEKALNGSVTGLKKYGIQLDKNASRQEVLEAIQKRFGGAAEAYGKTAAGAQERFGIALEGVKEQIGTALLPLVTKFFDAVTKGLIWWQANWPAISKVIRQVYDVAAPTLEALVKAIVLVAKIVADVARLISAIANGEWGRAWELLKNIAVNYVKLVLTVIEGLPIVRVVKELVGRAVSAITEKVSDVANAAEKLGRAIIAGLESVFVDFPAKLGAKILNGIRGAATWVFDNLGTPFAKVANLYIDALTTVGTFYITLGKRIIDGIRAAAGYVIERVGGLFSGLGNALKSAILGELAGLGEWFKNAVKSALRSAGGFVGRAADAIMPGMAPVVPSTAYAGPGIAGAGGAGGLSARAGAMSFGTLGSSSTRSLSLPGLSSSGLRIGDGSPLEVRVYIGETELTQLVRTEVVRADTGLARTLLAGGRAT